MGTLSLKKIQSVLALCAALFVVASPGSAVPTDSCPAELPPLEEGHLAEISFGRADSRTLQSTAAMLRKNHYEEIDFDDYFSRVWLDAFLDMLDPTKSFLLQADVDLFTRKYADSLDDLSKAGDLKPAREIYTVYRDRAMRQMELNISNLNNPDYQFDFTTQRYLPTNREDYSWPVDEDEARAQSETLLTLAMLNLRLSGKEESSAREQLIRRYQSQLNNLRRQKSQQVLDLYLNALGHIYDPHTDYFSPRDSENFEINMSLSLEGIGAVLQKDDEFTKVVSLVPGGPAQMQSNLQAADRIVAIGEGEDCEFIDIVGWRLDDVVERIRGPKGTVVRLKVIPSEADIHSAERNLVHIVRDQVKLEDNAAKGSVIQVHSGDREYSLGIIDIPSFYLDINAMRNRDPEYRSTTRDVRTILDEFEEQGVHGVLIDLRQNGGGSLLEAATFTDLFLDPGPVVQIKDQNNRIYRNHRARSRAYYSGPLVILIDRLSASASEIFAGAVQDYGRGLVLGSQSFGKGTVQSVQQLPSGQLKLTESKFYRISGDSTQHKGVVPDIELPGLFNPLDIGESSYDNALGWDQIRGIPHGRYEDYQVYLAPLMEKHRARLQSDADLQYLLGTIALAEERRAQREISLNEAERIRERENWDRREAELLQDWHAAQGIEPGLDESSDQIASGDLTALDPETSETEVQETRPDISEALLIEAGRIFADFLNLTGAANDADLAAVAD